jgi:hypothetical protein
MANRLVEDYFQKRTEECETGAEPWCEHAYRKSTPLHSGVLKYFPDALMDVARCSKVGNDQHNPDQPLFWNRDKSGDELDALARHLIDAGTFDTDGIRHSTKVAWRALANLQKEIEREMDVRNMDVNCPIDCGQETTPKPSLDDWFDEWLYAMSDEDDYIRLAFMKNYFENYLKSPNLDEDWYRGRGIIHCFDWMNSDEGYEFWREAHFIALDILERRDGE